MNHAENVPMLHAHKKKRILSQIISIAMQYIDAAMFLLGPLVFQILTPDVKVRQLAAEVLRIELFAEPLYGVSVCLLCWQEPGD